MSEKSVDARALEEATRALWGGDAEPVSGEDLLEAAELMFGAGGSRPDPAPGDVDDWARVMFGLR